MMEDDKKKSVKLSLKDRKVRKMAGKQEKKHCALPQKKSFIEAVSVYHSIVFTEIFMQLNSVQACVCV